MPSAAHLWAIPDAVALIGCVVAVAIDVRHYRIPNWLTAATALAGLAANATVAAVAAGPSAAWHAGLGPALAGAALLLAVSGALALAGFLGMGDAKLLAAVGACVRWPQALPLLVYTALAGGVVALGIALHRGQLAATLRNAARTSGAANRMQRMPYAIAILAGTAWAVLARFVDFLRLL
jgi:prepilin peptidase CpaA